jgi:transposase
VGKKKSYFVVEQDGKIVKERYVNTDRESFSSLLGEYPGSSIVMEASSTIDRIALYVEEYSSDITVAHPMKLKVISQSMKMTDRNDAHILLELNRLGYVPESYLPSVDIRRSRDLCRNRAFLVKQRTAVKTAYVTRHTDWALTSGISTKRRIMISDLPAVFSMPSSMIWNP